MTAMRGALAALLVAAVLAVPAPAQAGFRYDCDGYDRHWHWTLTYGYSHTTRLVDVHNGRFYWRREYQLTYYAPWKRGHYWTGQHVTWGCW